MVKNTIFTYYNHQIHPDIATYQHAVINKIIEGTDIDFNPLKYNADDGQLYPDNVIHYGLHTLFDKGYENIFILDIDCIPLSLNALTYTFDKASNGTLIGNAQRSHHLDNNEHIFVGSSCLCLNGKLYESMGVPSFTPTNRGDIAEELAYVAEEKNIPIEFFVPHSFESKPNGCDSWALTGDMKPYGIGTTFMKQDGELMFYHLFESRTNLNVERFVSKCQEMLNLDN
jgi:hypothetical protein